MNVEKMNAKVFLKVAETGSFRKAADLLDYTQAGISYIIAAMESETGLTLFLREHGGVRLSTEGEALLPYMKQLEAWERQVQQSIDEIGGLEKGNLKVQIFNSISIHWIPGILKRFHDDYPGIHVELISAENGTAARQMLENGEVDCGFFKGNPDGNLEGYPLINDHLLACVGPDHPLYHADIFPMDKLGEYPYVSMKFDDHTGIHKIFTSRGIEPNTAFYMDNDYAAMAMVSKGLGYGIFPELLLKDIPYDLHRMEFEEPQSRMICIGTRSLKFCSRACRKFIEYAYDWVKENYPKNFINPQSQVIDCKAIRDAVNT